MPTSADVSGCGTGRRGTDCPGGAGGHLGPQAGGCRLPSSLPNDERGVTSGYRAAGSGHGIKILCQRCEESSALLRGED